MDYVERLDRIRKEYTKANQKSAQLKGKLEALNSNVSEGKAQLQKEGIEYDTLDELVALKEEKSERVEKLLAHFENMLGID